MSKANDKQYHANNAGAPSTNYPRQETNVHETPFINQLSPPRPNVSSSSDVSSTLEYFSPAKEEFGVNLPDRAPSFGSPSPVTASPFQIIRTNQAKLLESARPAVSHAFRPPLIPEEVAASFTNKSTSPESSIAIRATKEERTVPHYVPPLLHSSVLLEGKRHAGGLGREVTTVATDPRNPWDDASKERQSVPSVTRRSVAEPATNATQLERTTRTPTRASKQGAGQSVIKKRQQLHALSVSRVTKPSRRPGHQFEMQWRVGQAPGIGLQQNQEQVYYENIVSAISRYYSGNAEASWKVALSHSTAKLDQNFEALRFMGLTMTVAGLISAGRSMQAYEALDQIAPTARNMLLSQHPMTFWLLIDQVMDTSQTVLGNLRAAITKNLASLARSLLGNSHPFTVLFKTPLTTEQKVQLRIQAQMIVQNELVRVFGLYAYQTFIQFGYSARIVLLSGHPEEAIRMLSRIREVTERQYGLNSAMPTLSMIEQARCELASGSSSVMVECLLADALRRNHILYTGGGDGQDPSSGVGETALRNDGLLFMRITALRMLGRVHVRRRSFGAAIYHFEQAVVAARTLVIPGSNTMRMYEADLEMAKILDTEEAMGILGAEDPSHRLANPFSVTQWVPSEDRM
jgi:hypothetical protein